MYKRAKSIADPFAFEEYKRRKIREKIEQERTSRIKIDDSLPKVNRDLASRLLNSDTNKKKQSSSLLQDDRFKVICLSELNCVNILFYGRNIKFFFFLFIGSI